jgi:allantoinase
MQHLAEGVSRKSHRTWLDSRPQAAEDEAIELLLRLGMETSVPIHIVHLSSSDAIPRIQLAKSSGVAVTVETCPHYLTFSSEGIPDGSTQFKCAPPIREQENREALWNALRDGTVDFVTTDHSPCPPSMKNQKTGDFFDAWGGIASLQLSLPAVWTEANKRGFSFSDVAKWLCAGPARLAGLQHKKGAIAPGYDADLAVWDPNATFLVEPSKLQHRHKVTPYAGRTLMGIVEATFLRGARIYERGSFQTAPAGRVLLRGRE